ncbi:protein of unknown function [Bradyrhizobium vignae]|uniref:Uncharacterized protein n=1 Tax=Bradyrhizobium vignae TaxID=1549949 RepID=A0A2U3Q0L5_9BRAD|nr:protein of unknown function [Bradyrhizobium vignae]
MEERYRRIAAERGRSQGVGRASSHQSALRPNQAKTCEEPRHCRHNDSGWRHDSHRPAHALGRQIVITRQFGLLNIRSSRDLADYHFISITDDYDTDLTTDDVNLCGNKGTEPITLQTFTSEEADKLANELGRILKLPARDYVGSEPDES